MIRAKPLPPCILCGADAVPVMVCGRDGYVMHSPSTYRLGYACPLQMSNPHSHDQWRTVHNPPLTLKRGKWQRAQVGSFGESVEIFSDTLIDVPLAEFRSMFGFLPPDAETTVRFRCHVEVATGKGKR